MPNRFFIVDVFAEQRYAGNPLAVVVSEDDLPDESMLRLAAEMNFSETTFVKTTPDANGAYRVRIFTPAREIDFAGHPLLGTAWVLRQHVVRDTRQPIGLNLRVGLIPVAFESTREGHEAAWFRAPPITAGQRVAPERISAALGLVPDDLDPIGSAQVFSAGTAAIVVPLRGLQALRRCALDLDQFAPLADQGCPPLVYVYCRQTHHVHNDICARFFFEAHGVREDPATGNGAAFLGAFLLSHRADSAPRLDLRIEQGYEVRRPSLVRLRAKLDLDAPEICVGGQVIPTVEGVLC
ncbi:MAG: PhzF family phenazine biosynthesis protein [Thiotrichales bacterium]